ncbi:XerC/D-like integrase [Haloferax elongans ATCC BAA-1513]|uniref:XerC/D-like integrase n=1 Tax=Haloferax elongans ATCC BAA-1513 TaxID=1230453 RepID=M0HUV5_HALEO|nr:site-specific integrase [Haloferax elongans]ELZ87503.1 XerC/D-like integrase [Haloferax elongans ATCC BAA-1513]
MTDLEPLSPEEGVERFLAFREPSVRKSTMQNAKTRLGHFLDWCETAGIDNLNDLTGRKLNDFVRWRQGDIAPITLQKQISSVRMALDFWADIDAVEPGLREKIHAPELPDGSEARDIHLEADAAEAILEYLDRYHYASRKHAVMALIWRTGMRRSTVRALDVGDLHEDEHAIQVVHRPESETPLKNGEKGERWVYIGPDWMRVLQEYVRENRTPATDDYGRHPLITTSWGRATGDTIYQIVNEATQPCEYGLPCPHDRDPSDCEAREKRQYASKCPSSKSPHAIRRGHITHYLSQDVQPEIISERSDVSLEILYQHYDARTAREKMEVRKQHLPS